MFIYIYNIYIRNIIHIYIIFIIYTHFFIFFVFSYTFPLFTTCRIWTASGAVHPLLVLEPTKCLTIFRLGAYIYLFKQRGGGGCGGCTHWIALHVEHSVCHEPISVFINIFTLLA